MARKNSLITSKCTRLVERHNDNDYVTMQIQYSTYKRLKENAHGDSYEEEINRLMDFWEQEHKMQLVFD